MSNALSGSCVHSLEAVNAGNGRCFARDTLCWTSHVLMGRCKVRALGQPAREQTCQQIFVGGRSRREATSFWQSDSTDPRQPQPVLSDQTSAISYKLAAASDQQPATSDQLSTTSLFSRSGKPSNMCHINWVDYFCGWCKPQDSTGYLPFKQCTNQTPEPSDWKYYACKPFIDSPNPQTCGMRDRNGGAPQNYRQWARGHVPCSSCAEMLTGPRATRPRENP